MAKTPAPAKTPTVAIARVLRGLGLKQGSDFTVKGEYKCGQRTSTYVLVTGVNARQVAANNADLIEQLSAEAGFTFNVSVYFSPGGSVWVGVATTGERVRQTHFLSPIGRTTNTATEAPKVTPVETVEAPKSASHFTRTEDGTTTPVTAREALDEINGCMIGDLKKTVRTMYGSGGNYVIEYRDGRKVRLTRVDGDMPAPAPIAPPVATGDVIETVSSTRALVTLSDGRSYIVDTRVVRSWQGKPVRAFTEYWTERDGKDFGATRVANEAMKPKTVGGRIWAQLVAAGIA